MSGIAVDDRQLNSVQFARLSEEQARRIHWASLEILEILGARLHHQEAIDLLRRAGAEVDDGNLVRVPAGLVEKAFATVPRRTGHVSRFTPHPSLPPLSAPCGPRSRG